MGRWVKKNGKRSYMPTRREIAKACEAIRAAWSEQELESRRVGWTQRAAVPRERSCIVRLSGRLLAVR